MTSTIPCRTLFAAIASGDHVRVARNARSNARFGHFFPLRVGASRQDPRPYFLIPIRHYVYAGDTALHVAAAAHDRGLAALRVELGNVT